MRPASYLMSSSILENVSWQPLLLLTLLIILTNISQSGAQSFPGKINIEKGGQLWIEGSAGRINFTCEAQELSGAGEIEDTKHPEANIRGQGNVTIAIALPVKSLDCGKRAMNKDMYEALKSDSFPDIQYQLLEANLSENADDTTANWMQISTRGIMAIAGVQDTTSFYVEGKLLDGNRFRVKGSKDIHMDTYDITPPRAMLGLIKADKNLTVHFDVTVKLNSRSD